MNENILISIEEFEKSNKYWMEKLAGKICGIHFSEQVSPKCIASKIKYEYKIDSKLNEKLFKISKNQDIALFVVMLTALKIQLAKITGSRDVIIVSPFYTTLGECYDYNKSIPLRDTVDDNMTFKELLLCVKKTVAEAYANQHYPIKKVLDSLGIDEEESSLYNVIFMNENIHSKTFIEDIINTTLNDITFSVLRTEDALKMSIIFNPHIFNKSMIDKIYKSYISILEQAFDNLNTKIVDFNVITTDEKNKVTHDFNNTFMEYPKSSTIQALFEEQVQRTPNNIALVFEDITFTYTEMNNKVNKVARMLRSKGVTKDTIVGLLLERSPEVIIGILAILKAGGAYLPIDPKYPVERINFILKDSGAKVLLSEEHLIKNLDFIGKFINIKEEEIYKLSGENLEIINQSDNLAYVIYTSGSTGEPKGVMIEHRSVVNFILWRIKAYYFTEDDTILQLISVSFDGFGSNLYSSLISGAKLVMTNDKYSSDFRYINEIIKKSKVTNMSIVPSMYRAILQNTKGNDLDTLRLVILAGERVSDEVIALSESLNSDITLVNEYGPTENTIATTAFVGMKKGMSNIIGKPISNNQVYILDKSNKIMGIGFQGELCISGYGLARGYLNRSELNDTKFIKNPIHSEERLYKTGDLARWREDGNIEFLGRIDEQVKIRGFRIELGEVEQHLLKHELIKEAVVLVKKEEEEPYLCAYLVVSESLTVLKIMEFMATKVPHYMIPTSFVTVDAMPLTSNGKINKKALLKNNNYMTIGEKYMAAENPTEARLIEMWQELFSIDKVGTNDDFFALGGHSLKATILIKRIEKEFNCEISLNEFFKTPNIKALAKCINNSRKNMLLTIEPALKMSYYPLALAQKRIYILNERYPDAKNYNMPEAVIIEGPIGKECFERALKNIVNRHECLRTSIHSINGQIVQKIHDSVDFGIKYLEWDHSDIIDLIKNFIRPFDLNQAPLVRAEVIKLEKDKHLLIFDLHHIIADGTSIGILMKEFISFCKGEELPNLKVQYKDFSVWEKQVIKSSTLRLQEKYWVDIFSKQVPILNMPTDFSRPLKQSFEGNNISFKLEKSILDELYKLANNTDTTLFMVLFAAYNILLSQYTQQEDIVVGTSIAGRFHADLENLIGMFINTLPLRNFPKSNKNFYQFLQEVKENSLMAFENQFYQFQELVENLNINEDLSRNPLFDTMFTLQNFYIPSMNNNNIKFSPVEFENLTSRYDFALVGIEQQNNILFKLNYCTKLFKKETMERFVEDYQYIIMQIIEDYEKKLYDFKIICK